MPSTTRTKVAAVVRLPAAMPGEGSERLREAEQRGNADELYELAGYQQAASGGHAPAHTNIGILLEHRGDGLGAEHAYRSGIEGGDAGAAYNLGVLLYRRGDD